MVTIVGFLNKMTVALAASTTITPEYYLTINDQPTILLNHIIGSNLSIEFLGTIKCIYCKQKTKKSYNQGYCYLCATKLARCDLCIVNPHKCHYHLGTCREPTWGEEHCFIPHIVYLANSSDVKVGVSRKNNLYVRWVDQGAIQGLPIISTISRDQAGFIEALLATVIKDKTNWRKMLSFLVKKIDLITIKNQLLDDCLDKIQDIINRFKPKEINILENQEIVNIKYPIDQDFFKQDLSSVALNRNNEKIVTIKNLNQLNNKNRQYNLNSNKLVFNQKLIAIKGQYLIFPEGVLNMRSLAGHEVEFNYW